MPIPRPGRGSSDPGDPERRTIFVTVNHREGHQEALGFVSLSASDGATLVPGDPSTSGVDETEETMLRLALRGLPDDQRAAIAYAVVRKLPVAEIARRMNRAEADVRSAMREGLWSLRSVMDVVDQASPAHG